LAVSLGVMMVALDGTVVGVANPTIQRDLRSSLAGLQWVTNGYLLALAVLLIVGGNMGDRFGRKRVFIIGIVGFALTSLGCALSGSTDMLIGFRVLQGVTGAMLMPNTLALLRASFPPGELNRAVGIWGATSALAVASGPIIGGVLVEHVSWESIFLLNVPLGVIAALFSAAFVAESRDERHQGSFDLPGVGLLSGGLFAVIWAIIKTQDRGWTSAYVLAFFVGGLVLLVLFAVREHRVTDPLLPLEVFRSRSVSAGTVLVVVGFMALFGVLFFVGLYLQNVHGYSPIATGVRLLPLTATFVISAPLGGVLTERFGPRPPVMLGMVLLVVAFLGLSQVEADSGYSSQWPFFFLIGLSFGLVIVSTTQAIVGNIPVERGGIGGGVQSTANQLGGVLGTAVFGSILVSAATSALPGDLRDAGVTGETAQHVLDSKELIGQGVAPLTGVPTAMADAVVQVTHSAFMTGLHTTMYVGAALAAIGALLGLLVARGRAVEDHEVAGH
jgi:EmrB/QacA subfamily drug resistance transporter